MTTNFGGDQPFGLVLSGGMALGAYQAGALAALVPLGLWPSEIAGTSTGALNAAVALGGPPATAGDRLRSLWFGSADPVMASGPGAIFRLISESGMRLASAMETLSLGRAGLFRPHVGFAAMLDPEPGYLSLDPLRRSLAGLVDFEWLNHGPVRFQISATDLVSGERVTFGPAADREIGPDEILAACAMPPLFAPIEYDGRILGDGGLSGNVPLSPLLRSGIPTIVLDLLPKRGERPRSMAEGASRAVSIMFATPTWTVIEAERERHGLEQRLALLDPSAPPPRPVRVVTLHYDVPGEEPGLARLMDFRSDALERRWRAGEATISRALDRLGKMATDTFTVEVCS